MKARKKIISAICALMCAIFAFALIGCGGDGFGGNPSKPDGGTTDMGGGSEEESSVYDRITEEEWKAAIERTIAAENYTFHSIGEIKSEEGESFVEDTIMYYDLINGKAYRTMKYLENYKEIPGGEAVDIYMAEDNVLWNVTRYFNSPHVAIRKNIYKNYMDLIDAVARNFTTLTYLFEQELYTSSSEDKILLKNSFDLFTYDEKTGLYHAQFRDHGKCDCPIEIGIKNGYICIFNYVDSGFYSEGMPYKIEFSFGDITVNIPSEYLQTIEEYKANEADKDEEEITDYDMVTESQWKEAIERTIAAKNYTVTVKSGEGQNQIKKKLLFDLNKKKIYYTIEYADGRAEERDFWVAEDGTVQDTTWLFYEICTEDNDIQVYQYTSINPNKPEEEYGDLANILWLSVVNGEYPTLKLSELYKQFSYSAEDKIYHATLEYDDMETATRKTRHIEIGFANGYIAYFGYGENSADEVEIRLNGFGTTEVEMPADFAQKLEEYKNNVDNIAA